MRALRNIFLIATFAAVGFLITTAEANAAELNHVADPPADASQGLTVGTALEFQMRLTMEEGDTQDNFGEIRFRVDFDGWQTMSLNVPDGPGETRFTISVPILEHHLQECIDRGGSLGIAFNHFRGVGQPQKIINRSVPCTVLVHPNDMILNQIPQTPICGSDNDDLSPVGMIESGVALDMGTWANNERVVRLVPAQHYVFPPGVSPEKTFFDDGPCIADPPTSPTQHPVCGDNNDTFTIPDEQPQGVIITPGSSGWSNNSLTFTYSTDVNHYFENPQSAIFSFEDDGPCETEPPIPPVVTEVCGPDNDVVVLSDDQPANVIVTSDGEWSEGGWTITFSAAENYALPTDAQAIYNLVDANTPCPTDAPVSPVQTAICGPDNDLLTIPDQPEGVTLDSDTDWVNNERIITFAVAPDFITDGPTTFTFTDANEPCPVVPVGKTVTVILETSDGDSIEGAEYSLFAPEASQAAQPAYEHGVVSVDNTIVFEDLMAGEYRLVVDADGYEQVDVLLAVGDGTDAEEFTFPVTALQVSPSPTVEPTTEPTVQPTAEPTAKTAPVTELPSTGSGPSGNMMTGFALAILALITVAVGSRRQLG